MTVAGLRYDTSPIGTGKNWVTETDPAGGLGSFVRAVVHALIRDGHSESDAIQLAEGVMKRWATGRGPNGEKMKPETVAKASAAVAHWEALKAAAHSGNRDIGTTTVTESTSAGLLLPKGPSAKQSKAITASIGKPHAFRGAKLTSCARCGKSALDALHVGQPIAPKPRQVDLVGNRTDISTHPLAVVPVLPGGASAVRKRRLAKASFAQDVDDLEPQFHVAMTDLFERQRAGTVSRLNGKRGKRMLAGNRAQPDDNDPTQGQPAASVDPSAIFDPVFWAEQTVQALQPAYDQAAQLGAAQVRTHIGNALGAVPDDTGSVSAAADIVRARAKRMGQDVTSTTWDQIKDALGQGMDNGESIAQLGDRVKHVFDVASTSRAQTVARTETIGAMNEAAHSYAQALPTGIVGEKEWLAHHDTRTRPTHRVADGQRVPTGAPFTVGGFPMQFPGDPVAPPSEVCNCRCSVAYIPAHR